MSVVPSAAAGAGGGKEVALVFKAPAPGPRGRRVRRKVLEEEAYVGALEEIIQRDFFPELPLLRAQFDYLTALENNDLEQLHALAARYNTPAPRPGATPGAAARRVHGQPTPRPFETPSTRGTPGPAATPTPRGTPHGPGPSSATPSAFAVGGGAGAASSSSVFSTATEGGEEAGAAPDTNMSLDAFLDRYTSEDNESFEDLIERTNEALRHRYAWLYEKVARQQQQLALTEANEAKKQLLNDQHRALPIEGWHYTAKNALMYYPEGVELTAQQLVDRASKNINEVHHANTRFARSPFARTSGASTGATGLSGSTPGTRSTLGGFGPTAAAAAGGGAGAIGDGPPEVNGYGFVSTPTPQPGVTIDPLLTWGTLAGPPVKDGTMFVMPAPSDRDVIGRRMSDRVAQKKRSQQAQAKARATGKLTPGSSRPGTPVLDRLASMSPAARRLASSRVKPGSSLNQALRRQYGTPGSTRRRGTPLSASSSAAPSRLGSRAGTPRSTASASVTDGLL